MDTENLKYLSKIKSPDDIKNLDRNELEELSGEIRKVLIETVSKTGGHLASNLGVVELTLAIHRVFDSPKDKIVWDVGHQCYTHKLITGRLENFDTLRQKDGLSGFCHPNESEHDTFYSGHSGVSVSAAYGVARANVIKNNDAYTVAVIGDGSFTGGLAFEGLNNAGRNKTNLIVILNDNEMSISQNVGALAKYLTKIRSKKRYVSMKARLERFLDKIPLVGHSLAKCIFKIKTKIKNLMYESTIFENMGFRYMGPVDGHNLSMLEEALETAKLLHAPVVLHVKTVKGKGYDYAEKSPDKFHGVSDFDINTGEFRRSSTTYGNEFGELMCSMAEKDKRITLITAAMSLGTGLTKFGNSFPERFFDVGIAEEHAVTFAAGLSKGGLLPVFAVYSTFLQRCYDQIIHDGALQQQKLVLAIDRAGFVGDDGETHNGLYDVAFLQGIPGVTIYSPATYDEMKVDFGSAFYREENVVAVRYPRGPQPQMPDDYVPSFGSYDVYGSTGAKIVIVTYGRIFAEAAAAAAILNDNNIKVRIVKLNRIKPIDPGAVNSAAQADSVFFYEEGVRSGGIGEKFASLLLENGYRGYYGITAVEDCFVKQAKVDELMKDYGFSRDKIIEKITDFNQTGV